MSVRYILRSVRMTTYARSPTPRSMMNCDFANSFLSPGVNNRPELLPSAGSPRRWLGDDSDLKPAASPGSNTCVGFATHSYRTILPFSAHACFSRAGDEAGLKHIRRQRDDDNQNKLLQINYCEEELLCIIHWVKFKEIKTKALLLKTLLLSKFAVSLVASWHVCVVHET
jgi:hypothetical protein